MGDALRQQCAEAVQTCEVALAALKPLLFRHKKDFGELQIGILAITRAMSALRDVQDHFGGTS